MCLRKSNVFVHLDKDGKIRCLSKENEATKPLWHFQTTPVGTRVVYNKDKEARWSQWIPCAYTKHHSCKRVLPTPLIIPLISQMFQTELCSLIEYQKWSCVHFSPKRSYGSNLCSHRFLPVSYPLSSYLFFQSQLWFRYKLWESFIQCH